MKKYIVVCIMLFGMLCLSLKNSEKDVEVCAKIDTFESLDDVKKEADLVVLGTKISEKEPTIKYQNDMILYAYTLSDFQIAEVLDDKEKKRKVYDEIKILENEFYDSEDNVNYHIAGYNKMKVGKQYLLYLSYSEENGWYIPVGVVAGKIPLEKNEKNVFSNDEVINEEVSNIKYEVEEKYDTTQLKKKAKGVYRKAK